MFDKTWMEAYLPNAFKAKHRHPYDTMWDGEACNRSVTTRYCYQHPTVPNTPKHRKEDS